MRQKLPRHWTDIRRDWTDLAFYERFETVVAYILTLVIAIVVVIALSRLIVSVVDTLVLRAQNPLDHAVFQVVFGEILTLLIALEFNHTLRYTIAGDPGSSRPSRDRFVRDQRNSRGAKSCRFRRHVCHSWSVPGDSQ